MTNANPKGKDADMLSSLKKQLLQEIKRTDNSGNELLQAELPYQYLWSTIEQMSNPGSHSFDNKQTMWGYGEKFLHNHLEMQAQIKKIVDQINFEINL